MTQQMTSTASRIILDVAPDRLTAHLRPASASAAEGLTAQEVLEVLQEGKIRVDDKVTARVSEFVELAHKGRVPPDGFLVAEAQAAVEAQDEQMVWAESFRKAAEAWQDDAAINYYEVHSIVTIAAGDTIGTVSPPVPGKPGMDVCGNRLEPRSRHAPCHLEVAHGVARAENDPARLVAKVAGQVLCEGNKISIVETVDVRGDVDLETGSIQSLVDVHIKGTVRDQFEVKSDRSITVGGAIEAAKVEAGRDVVVRGGVLNRHRGHVRAKGDVVAKFCEEANVRATGNISVCKEVMNSQIHSEGKFLAARGSVIGGSLYARQGVETESLGNEANVATRIAIGVHPSVFGRVKALEQDTAQKKAAAAKIRQTVEPLLANQKRLAAAQKETATELLYKAYAIEEAIESQLKSCEEMLAKARPTESPSLDVAKTIHEGVVVQIGRRQVLFQKVLKGPVRIEERKVKNVTEIVAVNQQSGSMTILPSCLCEDDPIPVSQIDQ